MGVKEDARVGGCVGRNSYDGSEGTGISGGVTRISLGCRTISRFRPFEQFPADKAQCGLEQAEASSAKGCAEE